MQREISKLKNDKCKLEKKFIDFLGHLLANEGLKAEPKKIESIVKLPNPEHPAGIQSFQAKILKSLVTSTPVLA